MSEAMNGRFCRVYYPCSLLRVIGFDVLNFVSMKPTLFQ